MKTDKKELSNFSEETIKEMSMENVEGGGLINPNPAKCNPSNNCAINCTGCGTPEPIEDDKTS